MDRIVRQSLIQTQVRQSCCLWIGVMIAVTLAVPLQAAEPVTTRPTQPRAGQVRPTGGVQSSSRPAAGRAGERTSARSPKVDHAVMPAGGIAAGQPRCSQCQRSACPQCRLPEPHHHAHAQCQHGLCPAHCPVRPEVFGFYGTQWRRWPGSGVVQASNNEAATPARPPRAEVPGAEEESLVPDAGAEDLPVPAAEGLPDEPKNPRPAGKRPAAIDPQSSDRSSPADEATAVDDTRADESESEASAAPQPEEASGDEPDKVVSSTAWRTFTATPPQLAVQP